MSTYISKYANGAAVDAALDKAESALQPGDIDDTSTAADKLWSAQKISGELGNVSAALDALNGESV